MKDIKPTHLTPDLAEGGIPDGHPYANIFPMMDTNGEEFIALVKDIKANGLRTPIVLFEAKILDGRHRQAACILLSIQPEYVEYVGSDPIGFVTSQNLHRRHLTASQRAMVGARILEIFEAQAKERQREAGGDRKSEEYKKSVVTNLSQPISAEPDKRSAPKARDQAAAMAGSSPVAVQQAKRVQESGVPELQTAVDSNHIAVSEAAGIAELPPEQQANVVTLPKRERQAVVQEHKAERIKVETGISKEFSRIYQTLFSLAIDISKEFIGTESPSAVAAKAIRSFPYQNEEFCKHFLPHLAGVAELFSEISNLNEHQANECKDAAHR